MASLDRRDLLEYDVLAVTSLVWFLAQFVRYTFPPLFGTFQAVYGVSTATLGVLFTSLMLAYAAMQFPSGALADRIGTTRVVVAGAVVAAGGVLLVAGVRSFLALAVGAVLIGLGTGAHKTVAITLVAAAYPGRTGRVLGTMDAIGHLGGAAGPAAVVLVLSLGLPWGVTYLAIGVALLGLAAVFRDRLARRGWDAAGSGSVEAEDGTDRRLGDDRSSGADEDRDGTVGADDDLDPTDGTGHRRDRSGTAVSGLRAYLAPFADPRLSTFVLVTVAFSVAWNGLTAFLPLYLSSVLGLSSTDAGLVYGSLFLMALVQPATGALADYVGRYGVMLATLGLAVTSLVVLLVARSPVVAVAAVPLIGLGGHGFRPVRDAHLVATIPESVGGGTLGIARTLMLGTGATAPAVVGYLSEGYGFGVAFGGLAAVVVLAAGLVGALAAAERVGQVA